MRFDFRVLPHEVIARPVVDVTFPARPGTSVPLLVDSGAMAVRLPAAFGALLGVDVSGGVVERVSLGGATRMAHVLDVPLSLGHWTWATKVAFVEGLDFYGVAGLVGFFDQFKVSFDAQRSSFELQRPRYHGP